MDLVGDRALLTSYSAKFYPRERNPTKYEGIQTVLTLRSTQGRDLTLGEVKPSPELLRPVVVRPVEYMGVSGK